MIKELTLEELLKIVSGTLVQNGPAFPIQHISTDSRKILSGRNTLFIALEGSKYDGHHFVTAVYQAGVRHFILKEGHLPKTELPEANKIGRAHV